MTKKVSKWTYLFGMGKAEGAADMRNILGGKGANLAEMSSLGFSVPPGFTITSDICLLPKNSPLPSDLIQQIDSSLSQIENFLEKKFGDPNNPLLLSIRSGARVSMPGMMDTILNLGMNDEIAEGLAEETGNTRFAYDNYRRFIQMYANVVFGIDSRRFENCLRRKKESLDIVNDQDLSASDLKEIVQKFKDIVAKHSDDEIPADPREQLSNAIISVVRSWMSDRAITYRSLNDIPEAWGTAVNIQSMVFGNMNDISGTGIVFSRDPSTGDNELMGEYLMNAQGEEVVAGIRTPHPINVHSAKNSGDVSNMMQDIHFDLYQLLHAACKRLEAHYLYPQDIEFTIQDGKLWILQTRKVKFTAVAAIRIAVDMVNEGIISKDDALTSISAEMIGNVMYPRIDKKRNYDTDSSGLPASPGAACGKIAFDCDDVERFSKDGCSTILVRHETSPEDIKAMSMASGILTCRGGITSHAAIVSRGMGKPCVCAASGVIIDYDKKTINVGDKVLSCGDVITIDGSDGSIILQKIAMITPGSSGELKTIIQWAKKRSGIKVKANADTAQDIRTALEFDADGVGLCRTEHMFFSEEKILQVRKLILSDAETDTHNNALSKLLEMQKRDFCEIFKVSDGGAVNIRLLDPPLHEFLPHDDKVAIELSNEMGISCNALKRRIDDLKEVNPMMGHRGCRLGISHPHIYEMQMKAIFSAACDAIKDVKSMDIEIMVPFVIFDEELRIVREMIDRVALSYNLPLRIRYSVGVMIELPRAALIADKIAKYADYFCFGTNDLTQTTMGISRDDSESFMRVYRDKQIISCDPFSSFDAEGVGELMKIAACRGRRAKKAILLGICGEHGGDYSAIKLALESKFHYVSCSPYRIPTACLHSAHAVIEIEKNATGENSFNIKNSRCAEIA